MSRKDLLIALLIVTIWGANFTVIKLGLSGVPPFLLASLRFLLASIPAVFLVARPAVPFRFWAFYGLTVGAGQFGCLFYAMHIGMPAGVASVVLQAQAFFTLLFAWLLLKERITTSNLLGLFLAALGVVLAGNLAGAENQIPLHALGLTVVGAACWGISNIIVRQAANHAASRGERLDIFSLVVWSSLIPPIPLALGSIALGEFPDVMATWDQFNALSFFSVAYLAYAATLFGYGAWSSLLSRYPAGKVAPLSLLVPVTGLLTATLVLKETLSLQQWIGCVIVCAGLALSMFGVPTRKKAFLSPQTAKSPNKG